MCDRLAIPREDLVFIDDINLPQLHAKERLKLVLVDHNELALSQASCRTAVIEILDHHQVHVWAFWFEASAITTAGRHG